jgi:CheY-like chemotaxis protein/ketosteroid isomerase-like protein
VRPLPRILVIEDDPDTLDLTVGLLRTAGLHVTGVTQMSQAYDLLLHQAFELVLADLFVDFRTEPESWHDIERLRTTAGLTPIGLLTGARLDPSELARHGLTFALMKPFSSEDLIDAIGGSLALPDVPASRQAVLRSYFACLERSDWDRIIRLCTTDVIYNIPGDDPRFSRTVRGQTPFRDFAAETFAQFADPRFAVTALRPLPADGVLVRYDGSWRSADGQRRTLSGAIFFRFEGDAIAEIGVRIDLAAMPAALRAASAV